MAEINDVFIIGAGRSAIGRFNGGFKDLPASRIAATVIRSIMEREDIPFDHIDEVIIGTILSAGQKMGPGRQASIYSGIPDTVPAWAVNMLCGSGMKAVMLGADLIRLGRANVVVTGGMENMSRAPYLIPPEARTGMRMGHFEIRDHILEEGLTDVFNDYHMGITAENIAQRFAISREEQDRFALESQRKAAASMESGRFEQEICSITIPGRKGATVVTCDEHPRPDTTLEQLSKLRPAFDAQGTVTAGNASGVNDGAAIIILASAEYVRKRGLKPFAKVVEYDQAGVDPAFMGMGPVPAIEKTLHRAHSNLQQMELIELNEAFAAQSLGVLRELSKSHGESVESILSRTNVNGGAIALGHPVGASGARIIVTLLYEMIRRSLRTGLASLCIGGGMGTALIIERLE